MNHPEQINLRLTAEQKEAFDKLKPKISIHDELRKALDKIIQKNSKNGKG